MIDLVAQHLELVQSFTQLDFHFLVVFFNEHFDDRVFEGTRGDLKLVGDKGNTIRLHFVL